MVLHLGGDYIIPVKNILFILDYGKISENRENYLFIKNCNTEKIKISKAKTKSIVFTDFMGKHQMFFSPLSCATLKKRAEKSEKIFKE